MQTILGNAECELNEFALLSGPPSNKVASLQFQNLVFQSLYLVFSATNASFCRAWSETPTAYFLMTQPIAFYVSDIFSRRRRTSKASNLLEGYVRVKIMQKSETVNLLNNITKTRPCNIQQYFTAVKMFIFRLKYFSYFSSKHRLWVHFRTASLRRF